MPPQRSTISAPAPTEETVETNEAAVIDVGSNSVRLVVYRVDGRALIPTLNEKVMAALGRNLPRTGRLSKDGAAAAIRALIRFREVLASLGVSDVQAVATAAVREAKDGPDFVDRVAKEAGFDLRVLAGADEARLSALGVLGGSPEAEGVVGDLGGSSLELVEVYKGVVGRGETFALGHLALHGDGFDYERVAAAADEALLHAETIEKQGRALFAVGGAWRAMGRIAMALADHPLHVLHHYEMPRAQALTVADFVRRQSKRSLAQLEDAAAKRADALPFAATVMERLILRGGFERVVLSSFGLREGVLLDRMGANVLGADPLVAGAEAFAGPSARARAFGQALERWIEPVFAARTPVFSAGRDASLRAAAARLADLGGALHPDQRGELIYELVLRAPLAGISHGERAFLAAAVHHRYTKSEPVWSEAYEQLLDEEGRKEAMAVGAALRLGADLSARSEDLLNHFTLRLGDGALVLRVAKREADLVSEQAQRRLDALAAALGLQAQVELK